MTLDVDAAPARNSAVPRTLTWAVVKRIDPRLWDTWGHWWIEFGEESYGWWPDPCPMGWRAAMLGTGGVLNGWGTTTTGTRTRDAYHGEEPDHWFYPTLILDKSDEQVRAEIRAFAQSYAGGFRWQWWWLREGADNCRTFQDRLFEAVGLYEEPDYLYTRGSGCPFMFPLRRVKWGVIDALAGPLSRLRDRLPEVFVRAGHRRNVGAAVTEAAHPLASAKARARARTRGTLVPDRQGPAPR